ncbi:MULTISPECIES: recombinase RecT [Aurantimonas]|uniref:recombinase RecT n=1 Tax=Aurantimonas TaxID=182269 RepID=UPI0035182A02
MSNELTTAAGGPNTFVAAQAAKAIIPGTFAAVWEMSALIAASGMAPKDMKSREQVAVALLHGLEIGLTPMAALQSIAVINGRPSIWGDGAIGLVRGSGLCEYVKEWTEGEGDEMVAWCEVKRKSGEVRKECFSVAEAKRAQLWGKSGPWAQYPRRMLAMRARAWVLRDTFADVLRGLAIAEEIRDISPDYDQPPAPPAPPKKVDDSPAPAGDETGQKEAEKPADAEAKGGDEKPPEDKKPAEGSGPPVPPKSSAKREQTIDADPFDKVVADFEKVMAKATTVAEVESIWANGQPAHETEAQFLALKAVGQKHKRRCKAAEEAAKAKDDGGLPDEGGDAASGVADSGATGGDGFDPKAFRSDILERLEAAQTPESVEECLAEVEAAVEAGQLSESDKVEHLDDHFAEAFERLG